ncbi:MAG TPA: hypothetical protein VK613_00495 [Gaiellaceae bacterium]|nr:hypothetical protein [Gaiellaceae bacterium]
MPGEAGVLLLRPRLQPLRAKQREEAVTVLAELLLTAPMPASPVSAAKAPDRNRIAGSHHAPRSGADFRR